MLEQRMKFGCGQGTVTKGSCFQIFVSLPDFSIIGCEAKIWVDLQEKSVKAVSYDEANLLLAGTFWNPEDILIQHSFHVFCQQ
jgi:hypothetical protein